MNYLIPVIQQMNGHRSPVPSVPFIPTVTEHSPKKEILSAKELLQELHGNIGIPRLEIEGAGERSSYAMFLGWISQRVTGKKAVYVIENTYERPDSKEKRTECLVFETSELEKLIEKTLENPSLIAISNVRGEHLVHDRTNNGSHQYSNYPLEVKPVEIHLSLELSEPNHYIPKLNIKFE